MGTCDPRDHINALMREARAAEAAAEALPECGQTCDGTAVPHVSAAADTTRLDTQETTVTSYRPNVEGTAVIDFEKWMNERGTERSYFIDPVFDETSASSRFRHASWATIRRRMWAALVRTGQSASRRSSFGACGSCSWIERRRDEPDKFRVRYNHCRDRLCTPCANARIAELVPSVLNVCQGKRLSFITLTLCGKNEPLTSTLDKLLRSFRALRQLPGWADSVRGGAAFLEVKRSSRADKWHPHLHIIAEAKWISKQDLSDMWRAITKDSYIVDIARITEATGSVRYVTKYAGKPISANITAVAAYLDEAITSLKGRRLCFAFGDWYGTALRDMDDDGLYDEQATGWTFFDSLESIITRANSGERDAIKVLTLAGAEAQWRRQLAIDTS